MYPSDRITETQWTAHDFDINVHESELDDRDVVISFISGDLSFHADFTALELIRLRDALTDAIGELFESDELIQCPACGYTAADAESHGDHQNCRLFPLFPGETGESLAVRR